MNNILTLNDIATKFAREANISFEEALQSIEVLLNQTRETIISTKENVVLPGLGEFSVDNYTLVFTPDSELAETVNEPFAFFEPAPYFPEAEIEDKNSTTSIISELEIPATDITTENPETSTEIISETTDIKSVNTKQQQVDSPKTEIEIIGGSSMAQPEKSNNNDTIIDSSTDNIASHVENSPNYKDEAYYIETKPKKGFSPIAAYILGILTGMVIICIAVYFLYPPIYESTNDDYTGEITEYDNSEIAYITSDSIGQSDSISDTIIAESLTSIPVQPSPADIENTRNNTYDIANSNLSNENQIVTDTVSATNFLATMSRKYFGRMEFWVYIYLENKDKLQDPDHVPAGTVVVIPSRSKYGIDPDSPESIEKAKAMTAEVYKP